MNINEFEVSSLEFLAATAVIVVLCVMIGVNTGLMAAAAASIIGLLVAAMALFFIWFFFSLIRTKTAKGFFLRIEKNNKYGFPTAIYSIDGKEYPCVFPAETFFVSVLYKKHKLYRLFFSEKKCAVFDRFALITCITGFVCSIAAVIAAVELYIKNF